MSLPQLGHNTTWGCINEAFFACGLPPPLVCPKPAGWWERGIQNILAMLCKSEETEVAIALDYDSVFTGYDLDNLLSCFAANPQIDALAAFQPRRGDGEPMLLLDEQIADPMKPVERQVEKKLPIKVRTAHFGLTLIRLSRLKDIPMPWFLNVPGEGGSWEHLAEGKTDADIYFWNKWHEHGRNAYVLPGVRIGHLEQLVAMTDLDGVTRHRYYERWREQAHSVIVDKKK